MNHLSICTIFAFYAVSSAFFGRSNEWPIQNSRIMSDEAANKTKYMNFMKEECLQLRKPYYDIYHILLFI